MPGAGSCAAAAATLEHPPGATLVVARAGVDGLTPDEAGLLRSMARVASLTMRMQGLLDQERAVREEVEKLAREQAALRHVATQVAEAAPPTAVFATVAEEVGRVVVGADVALVGRYDSEGGVEFVGGWSRDETPSFVGNRVRLGGHNVSTLVFERKEPARVDHYDDAYPATTFALGWARSAAGAPITVEGRLWGLIIVGSSRPAGLSLGIEHQLADFTDVVATGIANTQAREELRAIADDQAALRRVATLVARDAPTGEIFDAVTDEVHRLLEADQTGLLPVRP